MKLNNAASLPVKLLRYLLMAFVLLISLYLSLIHISEPTRP